MSGALKSPDERPDAKPGALVVYQKIGNAHGAHEDEDAGEGPWLMSFADMVTLLMCFFILFFQTEEGNIKLQDPEKMLEQLRLLQQMLGVESDVTLEGGQMPFVRSPNGAEGAAEAVGTEMRTVARELDVIFFVGVPHPGELELSFQHERFFQSGSNTLTPAGKTVLARTVGVLRKYLATAFIDVEGYTDADPTRQGRYPSNWELSGARAASVVRELISLGIAPARLSFRGFGEFQPIMPERDAKGRSLAANKAANRRIVLRVRWAKPGAGAVSTAAPGAKQEGGR